MVFSLLMNAVHSSSVSSTVRKDPVKTGFHA